MGPCLFPPVKCLIGIYRIAGLVAARVLSDHFETVFVVEPDAIAFEGSEALKRTRVLQWNCQHGWSLGRRFALLLQSALWQGDAYEDG